MNAAVFFDRDNTLIHNDADLGDPTKIVLIRDAAAAIASLRGLGYKIVVVTNQGGVARGKYTQGDVDACHRRLNELVRASTGATIDRFYFCPYHPEAVVEKYRHPDHPWRKPAPGMMLQAIKDMGLSASHSWLVGDQQRDIDAGLAAGVRSILLKPDMSKVVATDVGEQGGRPYLITPSLTEAVKLIAQHRQPQDPNEPRRGLPTGRAATGGAAVNNAAVVTKRQTSAMVGGGGTAVSEVRNVSPIDVTPAVEPVAPVLPTKVAESTGGGGETPVLQKILQELRNQRADREQFSYAAVIAIVLQMVGGVCFLGAFLMGQSDADFLRWMGAAVVMQLGVIATLLFDRR